MKTLKKYLTEKGITNISFAKSQGLSRQHLGAMIKRGYVVGKVNGKLATFNPKSIKYIGVDNE